MFKLPKLFVSLLFLPAFILSCFFFQFSAMVKNKIRAQTHKHFYIHIHVFEKCGEGCHRCYFSISLSLSLSLTRSFCVCVCEFNLCLLHHYFTLLVRFFFMNADIYKLYTNRLKVESMRLFFSFAGTILIFLHSFFSHLSVWILYIGWLLLLLLLLACSFFSHRNNFFFHCYGARRLVSLFDVTRFSNSSFLIW